MEKQKKSVGTIALVVLLLIVTIASLVLATYAWAKYSQKSDASTATANVAKWNVTLDSTNKNFAGTYTHVVSGNIAPGTKGSFTIEIDPNDTEVCIAYQIALDSAAYTKANGSTLTGIEHLKFFTVDPSTAANVTTANEIAINGTVNSQLTGYIDLSNGETGTHNSGSGNKVTKTIYWIWPYDRDEALTYPAYSAITTSESTGDAYDAVDTAVGEQITDMTLTYSIRAWQVDPANSNGTDETRSTNVPGNVTNVLPAHE